MPIINGTVNDDILNGTADVDEINGLGGADTIQGGLGADVINGGDGDDYINHNSYVTYGEDFAVDILNGGGGDDIIDMGSGDIADGGAGFDRATVYYSGAITGVNYDLSALSTASGVETWLEAQYGVNLQGFEQFGLVGTAFNDIIRMHNTDDSGRTQVDGRLNATAEGGAGDDQIFGGTGHDEIFGGEGNDILRGGGGADLLIGGAGNDTLDGGTSPSSEGNYALFDLGTTGQSVTIDLNITTAQNTGEGMDTITNISNIYGLGSSTSSFRIIGGASDNIRNYFSGGSGNDTLEGRSADDLLDGRAGADLLDGGSGVDEAQYVFSNAGVTVNLTTNTGLGGHAQGDTFISIENLLGSRFADVLTGNASNNRLTGGGGDDVLSGQDGADILTGGLGVDVLFGGSGADTFVYSALSESTVAGADLIADFQSGSDRINVIAAGGRAAIEMTDGQTTQVYFGLAGGSYQGRVASLTQIQGADVITAAGGVDIFGSAAGQFLIGGTGSDTLIGRGGADTLAGGTGADTFFYNSASESTTSSFDQILDFVGGTDILHLFFADQGQVGMKYENGYVNVYFGNDGSGNYSGLIRANSDIRAADILTSTGTINVFGSTGDDTLISGNGADFVFGDTGNDTLVGQSGADRLVGGAGADTFFYGAASDTGFSARDQILDFQSGQDKINVFFGDAGQVAIRYVNGHSEVYFGNDGTGNFAGMVEVYGSLVTDSDILTSDSSVFVFPSASPLEDMVKDQGQMTLPILIDDSFIDIGNAFAKAYVDDGPWTLPGTDGPQQVPLSIGHLVSFCLDGFETLPGDIGLEQLHWFKTPSGDHWV